MKASITMIALSYSRGGCAEKLQAVSARKVRKSPTMARTPLPAGWLALIVFLALSPTTV